MNKNALSDYVDHATVRVQGEERAAMLRAIPLDVAFAQALEGTLTEWIGVADDEAFKDFV